MLKRVREEGDDGISHRSRGKVSNRRVPMKIKEKALKLFKEKYYDFGPTFASEKLLDVHAIKVSKETLRLWLNKENIPYEKRTGRKHRQWREKSIGTTSCCFLKADIFTLLRIGHFYFALTNLLNDIDIALNQAYIRGRIW